MPIYLRQSTASQEVPLGYFLDSTDGNTEETGLTIANTDIKIWKAGATTLANKNSGGATHISNGVYYAVLDATDTNTIGSLVIFIHVTGALAIKVECVVLDEAVYDVLFGTTAPSTLTQAQVNTEADTALTDYDGPTNAELATALAAADDAVLAAIAALNNVSQAQVNTQVDTALDDYAAETMAEPAGVPAWPMTRDAALAWLTLLARNLIEQTNTTQTVYADDGVTPVATSAVATVAGVTTREEFV